MPITTEHCKQFLADHFKAHPAVIIDLYGSDHALADAQNASKWKRSFKKSAKLFFEEYDSMVVDYGGTPAVKAYPASDARMLALSDVVNVRLFELDPAQYDTAVAYLVLEDKQGRLHRGEHVGD